MSKPDPNFGSRMAAIRKAQGTKPPGRKKLIERHSADVAAVERIFAKALPSEAVKFVRNLEVDDPEACPRHHEILECPDELCNYTSQRRLYKHGQAQYIFDRIMGKPTTRSEVAITVRLVEQIILGVVMVFGEVNGIPDADDRRATFAERCRELSAHFGGGPPGAGDPRLETESA